MSFPPRVSQPIEDGLSSVGTATFKSYKESRMNLVGRAVDPLSLYNFAPNFRLTADRNEVRTRRRQTSGEKRSGMGMYIAILNKPWTS